MSAESVRVTFLNETDCLLILIGSALNHGIWNPAPPQTIIGTGGPYWENDSNGNGAQGAVTYAAVQVQNGIPVYIGNVSLGWDDPVIGSNSYTVNACSGLTISYTGGSGDNANITVTLALSAGSEGTKHTATVVPK